MVSKKSRLVYEFTGVSTSQTIDIDPATLGMDDGNNLSTVDSAFMIDVNAISQSASFGGFIRRRAGYSYKSSTLAFEGDDTISILSGNISSAVFTVSGGNIRITLNLAFAVPTNIRVFVEAWGYNN